MPYYSTLPLNRPTICLVCLKHIGLGRFTKLHNLTYFWRLVSRLSLSMWDPSPRQLASISQIVIKEPPNMYVNTHRSGLSYFHLVHVQAQLKTKLWNEYLLEEWVWPYLTDMFWEQVNEAILEIQYLW